MKIHKYGVVIIGEGPIKVEGWQVEREPEDPTEATDNQLLLGFAIHWAQEKFREAVNSSVMDVFREIAKKKRDEILSQAQSEGIQPSHPQSN